MFTLQQNTLPRILVTDDKAENRYLLERLLKHAYIVDLAENGQEALDKIYENDYDLVLLDLMMPVLDGLEVLRTVREHVDLATLPIIIVSALNESNEVVHGIEMGANDYIIKPIEPAIVLARVKTQVTLKRLMDERQEAVAVLERANQMKARMMQIASHDLRNPLNNLNLLLKVLDNQSEGSQAWEQLKAMADDSMQSMSAIIDDYLNNPVATHEALEIHLDMYNAATIVEATLNQYHMMAQQKGIRLHIDIQDAFVTADADRLLQVLNNLVSNAIKYSPADSDVYIQSRDYDDHWRLDIIDSGIGIPEQERQHLFKAFSKRHISTQPTAGESSTGLGLWIAAEMMRLQNGQIGMDAAATGGSNFWITLPLAQMVAQAS